VSAILLTLALLGQGGQQTEVQELREEVVQLRKELEEWKDYVRSIRTVLDQTHDVVQARNRYFRPAEPVRVPVQQWSVPVRVVYPAGPPVSYSYSPVPYSGSMGSIGGSVYCPGGT